VTVSSVTSPVNAGPNGNDTFTFTVEPVQVQAVTTSTGVASGAAFGGTPITITGTGFGSPGDTDQVVLVPVGGGASILATNVVVVNDTTITAVTAGATASIPTGQTSLATDVEVAAAGQVSSANPPGDQYTYTESASISSITPPHASPAGGTQLAINGQGFGSQSTAFELVYFCPRGVTPATETSAVCVLGTSATNPGSTVITPTNDTSLTVVDPVWSLAPSLASIRR